MEIARSLMLPAYCSCVGYVLHCMLQDLTGYFKNQTTYTVTSESLIFTYKLCYILRIVLSTKCLSDEHDIDRSPS